MKNSKKGISLIVLVITIIVIIILATAILVSVISNNPIAEANKARYESDRDNMQAVFTNTVGKIMAGNLGVVNITAGQINTVTKDVEETTGEVAYTVDSATVAANASGTIVFDKGTNDATRYYTGKKLPIYQAGETKWYVDSEGVLSLEVAGTMYGNAQAILLEGNGYEYDTSTGTTMSFRSNSPIDKFKEVQVDDIVVESSNYSVTEGGTIITFTSEYMKTLSEGEHKIAIVSTNGTATGTFSVKICQTCNGVGTVNTETTCTNCNGSFTVFCSSCAGSGGYPCSHRCMSCDGGSNPTDMMGCSSCNGSGVIEAVGTCPYCQGSGSVRGCTVCNSKGTYELANCMICNGSGLESLCESCNGAAFVGCNTCDATGKVQSPSDCPDC